MQCTGARSMPGNNGALGLLSPSSDPSEEGRKEEKERKRAKERTEKEKRRRGGREKEREKKRRGRERKRSQGRRRGVKREKRRGRGGERKKEREGERERGEEKKKEEESHLLFSVYFSTRNDSGRTSIQTITHTLPNNSRNDDKSLFCTTNSTLQDFHAWRPNVFTLIKKSSFNEEDG